MMSRVGPRLTVQQQFQHERRYPSSLDFIDPCQRSKKNHEFRGHELAISVDIGGRLMRAADLFVDQRLSLSAEPLLMENAVIEIKTPMGNLVNVERLAGMKPEQIDEHLFEVDDLMGVVEGRSD